MNEHHETRSVGTRRTNQDYSNSLGVDITDAYDTPGPRSAGDSIWDEDEGCFVIPANYPTKFMQAELQVIGRDIYYGWLEIRDANGALVRDARQKPDGGPEGWIYPHVATTFMAVEGDKIRIRVRGDSTSELRENSSYVSLTSHSG